MPSFASADLFDASENGNVFEVSRSLEDPTVDVNRQWDYKKATALHIASVRGHCDVVKILLTHPDININARDYFGQTPISIACECNKPSVFRTLLKDRRVDVSLDDNYGRTPLWYASYEGYLEMIECLIASGKYIGDVENKKSKTFQVEGSSTALEIARVWDFKKIVSLLERYIAKPLQTIHELRVKTGMLNEMAANRFALIVFLCDGLLRLKHSSISTEDMQFRFLSIASRLPMEIQMILCHRVVGSMKQNIIRQHSEQAFKHLAHTILTSERGKEI